MRFKPQVFAIVPPVITPADDNAVEAYAAVEEMLLTMSSSLELGSPNLPCQQPCIELTITDDDGSPLAGVPYRLLVENTQLAEGTLDDTGFHFIPEQEVPPGDWDIEIVLVRNDETGSVERADILLTTLETVMEEETEAVTMVDQTWPAHHEPPYPWG